MYKRQSNNNYENSLPNRYLHCCKMKPFFIDKGPRPCDAFGNLIRRHTRTCKRLISNSFLKFGVIIDARAVQLTRAISPSHPAF